MTIDLARGHPAIQMIQTDALKQASSSLMEEIAHDDFRESDRHPMQYGTDQGSEAVREEIVDWEREHGISRKADASMVAMTCGASYGLMNAVLQFAEQGFTTKIFMITPAYFLAAKVFIDAGFEDCLTAIDEAQVYQSTLIHDQPVGPDLRQLEAYLKVSSLQPQSKLSGKRFRHIFYGVPTFSNPSGITWSIEARRALVVLARRYDMLIITDEVYELLRYDKPREASEGDAESSTQTGISRLVDIDHEMQRENGSSFGNCIANCSFSKYLGPGLRCGHLVCASEQMAIQFASGGANHSGGATSQLTSYLILGMLRRSHDGRRLIDKVIERLVAIYSQTREDMMHKMQECLPAGTLVNGKAMGSQTEAVGAKNPLEDGGYFLWITLPVSLPVDLPKVLSRLAADAKGVKVMPGLAFEVKALGSESRDWGARCFRLCFTWSSSADCCEGIRLLGDALRQD